MNNNKRKEDNFKYKQAKKEDADQKIHRSIELEPKKKIQKDAKVEKERQRKEDRGVNFENKNNYNFDEPLCGCKIHTKHYTDCDSHRLTKTNKK